MVSPETINVGPLGVRVLVTGDRGWQRRRLELTVAAAQRLAAPAHSHDHYEETMQRPQRQRATAR